MERYYFDANATTPPLPQVVETVGRAMVSAWGNPTSTHREGQHGRHLLEEARATVAASLGVPPAEVIFCASATEALHLLIRGLEPALGHEPALVFPGEHSACLGPLAAWKDVHFMPERVPGAATVVQMAASNETGVIHPVPPIEGAVRLRDCAQAWGKIPVDLSDADAAVFSGHKMGGPRGAPGLPWEALMAGPQERRRRGGTEDLPAILGLARAVEALGERLEAHGALAPLRDFLEGEVLAWNPAYEVVGRDSARLPNTSALLLRGHRGEAVHMALDLAGFAVSTGSACHSGAVKPSHAITSLGYSEGDARSVIRVSMLPGTTRTQVEALLGALARILKR
jgi:cysteine desulfurase